MLASMLARVPSSLYQQLNCSSVGETVVTMLDGAVVGDLMGGVVGRRVVGPGVVGPVGAAVGPVGAAVGWGRVGDPVVGASYSSPDPAVGDAVPLLATALR